MSEDKQYKIYGYTTGDGVSPQFMEPVFVLNEKFFSQITNADDKIIDFAEYHDEVEVLENGFLAPAKIGSDKVYAVSDVGERIITGSKDHLVKYLRQNLHLYFDKPFFLSHASKFCDIEIPELSFVRNKKDLLDAAVLSNSIRIFCRLEFEKFDEKKSIENIYEKLLSTETQNTKWLITHRSFSTNRKTVFERWLNFAEKEYPKLLENSEWSEIDKIYKRTIFSRPIRHAHYTFHQILALEDALKNWSVYSQEDEKIESVDSRSKSKMIVNTVLSAPGLQSENSVKHGNLVLEFIKKILVRKIRSKEIRKFEISMQVYFFKLVFKFSRELLSKDEAIALDHKPAKLVSKKKSKARD